MKVAEAGYKLDLHIHSVYSKGKDGDKVNFNTLENIDVLVQKLTENAVQMCAITDHDAFNYDMYAELKKYEQQDDCSIVKVFPGIEFSVEFEGDVAAPVVHVIAIFDDSSEAQIKKISNALLDENGNVTYDRSMAFSEEKFLAVLRQIDLDTILIAHQKNSLTSKVPRKSDANTVGPGKFEEFVYTDYFEAFEFRNKKNEIFNKSYLKKTGTEESIRFITGTDCHCWSVYPKESSKDTSEFIYTYIKCLPSFRGLVMAITDYRRIKTVNSFFNPSAEYLPQIEMTINRAKFNIPLSRGLNVIIGDNSIGKSLLLHKLTGYTKKQSKQIKSTLITSYDRYLRSNGVGIQTTLTADQIFGFDMQGEVREKFEESKIKTDEFLRNYYPPAINPEPYRQVVQRELNKIFTYLEEEFALNDIEENLGSFKIADLDGYLAESLTFIGQASRDNKKAEGLGKISSNIKTVIESVKTIEEDQWIEESDVKTLQEVEAILEKLVVQYDTKKVAVDVENAKISAFQSVINDFKQRYLETVSDSQKNLSSYNESIERTITRLVELFTRRRKNVKPKIEIIKKDIEIQTNRVYNYEFNSRLCVLSVDNEYIESLFERVFKKETTVSVLDMTREQLIDALLRFDGSPLEAVQKLKDDIKKLLDDDFKEKYTITMHGMDKTQELSDGFNAKIYFDLLSYESDHSGIYLIDQPEDNISQKAIKEYLLNRFKIMGEKRQVIIVTHNPQFIVNLDVDNVIYIGKTEKGMVVQSGALEYKDHEYSVLDIISTHIDGGLDTLKRRWKRYEKNNRFSDI
jgi:predicted ATP-dependent endonuclease of OLD family